MGASLHPLLADPPKRLPINRPPARENAGIRDVYWQPLKLAQPARDGAIHHTGWQMTAYRLGELERFGIYSGLAIAGYNASSIWEWWHGRKQRCQDSFSGVAGRFQRRG